MVVYKWGNSIHPYKEKFFRIAKDSSIRFYTGCHIFDRQIAINLASNKDSQMSFSIDSGTSETWRKIKGVDNFQSVLENIDKYLSFGVRPEQIDLKYIVLPGTNDNPKDYESIINIMKRIGVQKLHIAADVRTLHVRQGERLETLIRSASLLAAMLQANGMRFVVAPFGYTPDEETKILSLTEELLNSGEINKE